MQSFRIESDSLGEKQVPTSAYYGVQTVRGCELSNATGLAMDLYPEFIFAIAAIKKAAALANFQAHAFSKEICNAICQASEEVMDGQFAGQFPVDIIHGGGSISSHMNINEVIANRANEILTGQKGYDTVHPNTHVNKSQSTNDVIPAAMKIASYFYLGQLIETVQKMEDAFAIKQEEFKDIVKIGRTCVQDALPITLGQEFSGYTALIKRRKALLINLQERCLKLPLGGTAIGTKVGVTIGYMDNVYKELSNVLGFEVQKDENLFDGLQNADIYVDLSGGLKSLAISMSKIAADLRLLASGPNLGLKELVLPAVQPGSSIMPGKINPAMPELVMQACYLTCGNDVAINMAAEAGELDLNVWESVFIKCIAESSKLLTNGLALFTEHCIKGLKANKEYCYESSSNSLALSVVIASLIDYPTGGMVAKKAIAGNKSIKQVCLDEGILTQEQADILLDPNLLTDGELFAQKIEEYKEKIAIKV